MRISDIQIEEPSGLLRITTDAGANAGVEGICLGVDPNAAQLIRAHLCELLIGQEPFNRERLWQAMVARTVERGVAQPLWACVDVALWDLSGRALGQPIFRLIGGFRTHIPAILSGLPHTDDAEVIAEATQAQRNGFLGYRDRAAGPPAGVARTAQHLRRVVGDDFYLMHDGRRRYDQAGARQVGQALQTLDYHWFEMPLRGADLTGMAKLAAELDVPLLERVEGIDSLRLASQLLAAQAADVLRIRVPDSGGITDAIKIARLAESFGVHCEIEPGDAMGGFVESHLMGAIKNAYFLPVCGLTLDSQPLISNPLHVESGYVAVPTLPGLGIQL